MPDDKSPILFTPASFTRHDGAVRYIEDINRTRAPWPSGARRPSTAFGAWGRLASGGSISAASGVTLGSGSVKLCDQSGTVYPEDETVTVYNAGDSISASGGDKIVPLEWTGGEWSTCVCGTTSGCTATITGNVKGCSSANLEGATIEAHDSTSGGTLLGTATSDSSGNFTISVTGATAGNDIVVVYSHPRLTTTTTTLTWTSGTLTSTKWKCSATTTLANKTMSIDTANYVCACCPQGLAKTLYLTHPFFGSVTLTWNGVNQWTGTLSYSYGGSTVNDPSHSCVQTCASSTVTITFFLNTACLGAESWKLELFTQCPGATIATCQPTIVGTTETCDPSILIEIDYDYDYACCAHVLFGYPLEAGTVTITE